MSCFNKVSTITANRDLDLTKHVNYTSGMILGVDDFTQEFAYLAGRDRWLARDALGFGTVSGLKIEVETDSEKGPRVMVKPGVAISPRGQFICVPTAQCAYLNEWLAANEQQINDRAESGNIVSPPVTSPPSIDELKLYVVLCYRDCPVDNVPIPGEPCRSEDDLTAPSRIKDDFSLELRFEAPAQQEEEAVREFVGWLREISIVDAGASTAIEDFIEAVRGAWLTQASPPAVTSPPADLQINVADLADYMRTAFRLWVTELRNVLGERKTGCAQEMTAGGDLEDCVLLAQLNVPLVSAATGNKVSDSEKVLVGEDKRPFLLHLRMLQELLLGDFALLPGTNPPPVTSPPVTSPPVSSPPVSSPPVTSPPVPVALDDLSDVEISSPADGHVLLFDGAKWVNKMPETGGEGGVTDHGNLVGLGDDDHEQYLLIDGTRAMSNNLDGGGNRVINLKAAENNGEAVVFEQAIKQDDAAKGDLGGKYPAPTVEALQGNKISPANPNPDDILIFKDGVWTPQPQPVISTPPPPPPPKESLILPFATITKITTREGAANPTYEIWFNIDAPGNLVKVIEFKETHLQIHEETELPTSFLNNRIRFRLTAGIRNVFVCTITPQTGSPNDPPPSGKLRFRFDMANIGVEIANPRGAGETMDLAKYAEKSNIRFIGSIDGKFATIFVRGESGVTQPIR